MDYEALKDQWSDVEDRDGIRLSWNVVPSTRMVSNSYCVGDIANRSSGSIATRCPYRRLVHTTEREAGHTSIAI